MNNCREYISSIIKVYSRTPGNREAERIWRRFDAIAVEFDRVDWVESMQIAREFQTRIRECFYNCDKIAAKRPDLTYYEGMSCKFIPTEHAWLVRSDGAVIDPTYCWHTKKDDYVDYFGIPLTFKDRRHPRESFISAYITKIQRELKNDQVYAG